METSISIDDSDLTQVRKYFDSEPKFLDFEPSESKTKIRAGHIGFAQKVAKLIPTDRPYSIAEVEAFVNEERIRQGNEVLPHDKLNPMVSGICGWGRLLAAELRNSLDGNIPEDKVGIIASVGEIVERANNQLDASTAFRAASILLPFAYMHIDDGKSAMHDTPTYKLSLTKITPEAVIELLKI